MVIKTLHLLTINLSKYHNNSTSIQCQITKTNKNIFHSLHHSEQQQIRKENDATGSKKKKKKNERRNLNSLLSFLISSWHYPVQTWWSVTHSRLGQPGPSQLIGLFKRDIDDGREEALLNEPQQWAGKWLMFPGWAQSGRACLSTAWPAHFFRTEKQEACTRVCGSVCTCALFTIQDLLDLICTEDVIFLKYIRLTCSLVHTVSGKIHLPVSGINQQWTDTVSTWFGFFSYKDNNKNGLNQA